MKTCVHRLATATGAAVMLLTLSNLLNVSPAFGQQIDWKSIDARVEPQVFRVNVAMKVKLGDGQFAQLADLSPRLHYPVFVTTTEDKGYRVVGSGTCFAARTTAGSGTYFLTNKHVVDFADGITQECQRFFAAVHAEAERSAGFSSVPDRYQQLLSVINLASKKGLSGAERSMYQSTVDTIWDTYDRRLSMKADPTRQQFNKHLQAVGFRSASGFFLHGPGSSAKQALVAQVYKKSGQTKGASGTASGTGSRTGSSTASGTASATKRGTTPRTTKGSPSTNSDPDLCILFCPNIKLPGLTLQSDSPRRGDLVQAIGYPVIKQSGVSVPTDWEPALTIGRLKTISPTLLQFDAPVSKGDSGGPLINENGNVLGVVARRALSADAGKSPTTTLSFAAAVSAPAVVEFAPELFAPRKTPPALMIPSTKGR